MDAVTISVVFRKELRYHDNIQVCNKKLFIYSKRHVMTYHVQLVYNALMLENRRTHKISKKMLADMENHIPHCRSFLEMPSVQY